MSTKTKPKFVEREYRLCGDRSGLTFSLKTGKKRKLLVFDEEKEIQVPIRHCPNEPSIYTDKQSEYAFVEPIIFMHGYLTVKREKQVSQMFLNAHPDNKANGGNIFEMVNDEMDAEDEVETIEIKADIYDAIREVANEDGGESKLEAIVAVLEDSVETASTMKLKSLKRRLYQEVESNPEYFCDDQMRVNIFEDEFIFRKYFVLRAIREMVIKKSPNNKSMVWVRDNGLIATAPRGVELTDFFTDFLSSEDGMLVAEEIKRRS